MSNVMTPMNFYLIDAAIKWVIDNGCSPYVLIDATHPRASLPMDYVQDGKIVLNVGVNEVKNFHMDQDGISFQAGFGGRPVDVFIPTGSIVSVFAKETGQGIPMPAMPEEFDTKTEVEENTETTDKEEKTSRPSFLKVVK